ncbi:MAG: FxsA family protein [Gammaproteobacteria bacterium]|nr:FxsA family protein [Gammaproteobacteria bacterium]
MLFPLFVVVTLLEIYVLVSVGDAIGGFSTVLLVVLTALVGSSLLKHQGWSTMAKAQQSMAAGKTPAFEMMEGVVILVSGIMLLTPGFITDTVGLLGLIPLSRKYFINNILEKNASKVFNQKKTVFIHKTHQPHQPQNDKKRDRKDDAIEGEFWED